MTAAPDHPFWSRVRDLFQQAVSLDGTAREDLLSQCVDARVREEVLALIDAHDDAGGFLETSVFQRPQIPSGTAIGPYRIVASLGDGGMGSVFLGVRDDDEFEQRVAIKLIRGGAAGESIMRRFRQERQILAALEHPNIARLLDGGTTSDGLPYLVMEYVDGIEIDRYCEEKQCSTAEHIRLFLLLCDAVQYAHRNLVIHRDIKAGNVLITSDGVPKLLDFGIAKLISHDTSEATVTRLMTPDYASPEQLRGESVSTASDVYSLGVLLYRLVAGQKPFVGTRSHDSEPVRPSARNRALRGDLENILMMALQADPARRYGSVEQFASDLRRHLSGHPVAARPATLVYRASKFARRNSVAVIAAVVIVAVVAIAFVATLRQKRIAERRFEQVRALARSFVFEIHDAIAPLPGSTQARELLVRRALMYLDGLANEAEDSTGLRMELARAYLKVGDVQGLPYAANLGDTKGALASYRKALAIVEHLQVPTLAADAHDRIGFVQQRLLAWPEAMEHHQAALALRQNHRQSVSERLALARTWVAVGDCRYVGERWIDAKWRGRPAHLDYEAALRVLETIPDHGPYRGELLEQLGRANQRLGGYLTNPTWVKTEGGRALAHHDAALRALEQKSALEPLSAVAKRNVADQLVMKATLQIRLDDAEGAVEGTRRAAKVLTELAAADPTNNEGRHDLAFAHETEAMAHLSLSQWHDAKVAYERALSIRRALLSRDPANREDLRGIYVICGGLAKVHAELGEEATAARYRAEVARIETELKLSSMTMRAKR